MTAPFHQLEHSKLTAFGDAAAGHEGVLTDESGAVVVKPCVPEELAFYEETNARHPDFAVITPAFLGTLHLGTTKQLEDSLAGAQALSPNQTLVLPPAHDTHRRTTSIEIAPSTLALRGRAIDTETAIVLHNVAAGFVKPNILDVKLGKRLWDDNAPDSKRQKLDKVAAETTSGSLGFRVAGMKAWNGDRYRSYDKFYGRNRTVENVHEAFYDFFDVAGDDADREAFKDVHPGALEAVQEIERTIASQESRMYSSSLLFVYEGDRAARRAAIEAIKNEQQIGDGPRQSSTDSAVADVKKEGAIYDEADDDEEEEDVGPRLFDVRVIDFAHAKWTPGAGPDENMLYGLRSVIKIIEKMA